MAKKVTLTKSKGSLGFLSDVRAELTHVSWPTRPETIKKTLIVVAISVIVGIYLGALDYLMTLVTSYLFR